MAFSTEWTMILVAIFAVGGFLLLVLLLILALRILLMKRKVRLLNENQISNKAKGKDNEAIEMDDLERNHNESKDTVAMKTNDVIGDTEEQEKEPKVGSMYF